MFAASFVNNNPTVQSNVAISGAKAPFWIRVQRTGNAWTESWSVDGTNFTQAASFTYTLVVNQIGPYAGNCCGTTSPAFTEYVDYFFNTASPISPADGGMWNATTAPVISSVNSYERDLHGSHHCLDDRPVFQQPGGLWDDDRIRDHDVEFDFGS